MGMQDDMDLQLLEEVTGGDSSDIFQISAFLTGLEENESALEKKKEEFVHNLEKAEVKQFEEEAEDLLQGTADGDIVLYDINCQNYQVLKIGPEGFFQY